jgi:murein DD-endopeptidase MepM/ murein hydrolase activator NlpD
VKLKYFKIILIAFLLITSVNAEEKLESEVRGIFDFGIYTTTPFHYEVSSSMSGKYGAFYLFDSNVSTQWMSEKSSKPAWILVDFKEKRLMNRVEISFPSWVYREVKSYSIQVNVWGNWKTILKNQKVKKDNSHLLPGMDASQIRILFPETINSHLSVSDFKIFLEDALLNGLNEHLTGHIFPIVDGQLPSESYSLPGAPRAYRNGFHKGLDIRFTKPNPNSELIPLSKETEVIATAKGKIIRADWNYIPMNLEEFEKQKELTNQHKVTFVDRDFGGRQIWIDHGNGVITSFNHLSSIDSKVKVGTKVKQGQVLGKVGNSGLKGEAEGSDEGIHLHFEIWYKGEFLGKGLKADQSYQLLQVFFKPY